MVEFVPLAPGLQCGAIQLNGSDNCWLSSGGLYGLPLNCAHLRIFISPRKAKVQQRLRIRSFTRNARTMAFSGVLKLKVGPFWFKTTILLVNVLAFGRNTKYVLRIERPSICGGRIDLPIGRRDFPIDLLPRSANDRRKLRFGVRYGVKGKTIRFLAPTAEIYGHWIAVLREAFQRGVKVVRRTRNETASTIGTGGSDSDNGSHTQAARVKNVTDSMRGQRGSDALVMSISNYQHEADSDTNVSTADTTNDSLHQALVQRGQAYCVVRAVTSKAKQQDILHHNDDIEDSGNTESSSGVTPVSETTLTNRPQDSFSTDGDFGEGQQNVYCMATDRNGVMSFSVYTPPKAGRVGHAPKHERVFKLASTEWARWLARDVRDNEILPEVFHLTGTSCKRLQLQEIVALAQPFFA
ncbi:hypothetical protein ON010_g5140 [Phytophthora cinnamomi]|nr:hypothetical protein ON010_g5140 [Phytophthora cinnamomi]